MRLPYANAAALRSAYRFDSLQSFLDLYYLGLTVLQTGDDFYQMTEAYLARAAHESVRHAEVFISPQAHLRRGLPIAPIIENILAAFTGDRPSAVKVSACVCGLRLASPMKTCGRWRATASRALTCRTNCAPAICPNSTVIVQHPISHNLSFCEQCF